MAYNPNIHHRKSIRLPSHDYSQTGAYFITVCTHQRTHLFGEIIDGNMILNEIGRILLKCWREIPEHFSMVRVDEFIIMPNHMHGIIVIDAVGAIHESPRYTAHPQRAIHESPLQINIVARRNMIIPKLVGRFKMQAAKQINIFRNTPITPIWQRNYWERIIRTEQEMQLVRQYIRNNPVQWQHDVC